LPGGGVGFLIDTELDEEVTMTTQLPIPVVQTPDDLRQAAINRLRKKRALQAHLLAYVTVNAFLTGLWLLTDPYGFYWPMVPMLGWGIGLAFHVWDVYSPTALTEERIRAEMQRLSRSSGTPVA
jgi:hypothetical protein